MADPPSYPRLQEDDPILIADQPLARWLQRFSPWLLLVFCPGLIAAHLAYWQTMYLLKIGVIPLRPIWNTAVFLVLSVLICLVRPLGRWVGAQANIAVGLVIGLGVSLGAAYLQCHLHPAAPPSQYLVNGMGVVLAGIALCTQRLSLYETFNWLMRALLILASVWFLIESLEMRSDMTLWYYHLPDPGLELAWDKQAHFYSAAMLAAVAMFSELFGHRRWWLALPIVPVGLILAQVGIEKLQQMAGRSFEWDDIYADALGVAAGTAVYLLLRAMGAIMHCVYHPARRADP